MVKKDLFRKVGELGFPLLGTEKEQKVNLTLAEVVKSRDYRLWEGFPVLLANTAEKKLFDSDKIKLYLKSTTEKQLFTSLTLMSLALYKTMNLKLPWADQLYKMLPKMAQKEVDNYVDKFKHKEKVYVGGRMMSTQRLKTTFENYFRPTKSKLEGLLPVKEEFNLEFALSQVFSPKQKELFLKKLRGERLTKTENEYFSRVVKKKTVALANTELHNLAKKVLQYNR